MSAYLTSCAAVVVLCCEFGFDAYLNTFRHAFTCFTWFSYHRNSITDNATIVQQYLLTLRLVQLLRVVVLMLHVIRIPADFELMCYPNKNKTDDGQTWSKGSSLPKITSSEV